LRRARLDDRRRSIADLLYNLDATPKAAPARRPSSAWSSTSAPPTGNTPFKTMSQRLRTAIGAEQATLSASTSGDAELSRLADELKSTKAS